MLKALSEQIRVLRLQCLKSKLEAMMNPRKAAHRAASHRMPVGLEFLRQKKHDQSWNDRARKEVGREQRKDDGLGKRHKQIARHAREKKHRHKYNADADRGDERRHGDLLGAIKDGLS